ncbi:hypothetical protein DF3PA_80012 [Candidatus Defluviicoccus seviourii]|uniref:Uncharacterized protein n=1 Tax=Candidatus Defluviicoccus seviourii TaxID=2565273 RepID=A0A564WHD2_9PROT|nr:hypothetical protein DF3PA_80012 [Candidatus Defluviicoccus seviourii]
MRPFLGLAPDGWERAARELVFAGGVSPREVGEMTVAELSWWHQQLAAWANAGRS